MTPRRVLRKLLILACLGHLALGLGPVRSAQAAAEDLAMFYDSLAPYGQWVDYGKYGPVWRPAKVGSSWRPYLDGRWAPSQGGWVFETSEPWGWATYHYGNWMPTTEYGWVWSPGSTWYPSTAAWRTSDDYVGWAPIPPPDYAPEPAFAPAEGYNPEAPILDALAAPLWIFAQVAQFLLGFGQPFIPAYSYYNCINCLAPLGYGPIVYGGTFPLTDFYYPGYAPGAFYCFGPPFPYISRVCNVNVGQINNFVNSYNYTQMRNVLPPAAVLGRYPYLRGAVPPAVLEGRRFAITRAENVSQAEHALNRPGVLARPGNLPAISPTLPRFTPRASAGAVGPERLGSLKGMALPQQATRAMTPMMRRQIQVQRQMQGPPRIETRPEFRPLARPEAAPGVSGRVSPAPPQVIQAPGRTSRAAPRPTSPGEFRAGTSREVHAPALRGTPEGFRPAPAREFRQPSFGGSRAAIPREFRAAPPPVYRAPRPAPQPAYHPPAAAPRAVSPAPRGSAPAPSRGSAPASGSSAPQHPQHR